MAMKKEGGKGSSGGGGEEPKILEENRGIPEVSWDSRE